MGGGIGAAIAGLPQNRITNKAAAAAKVRQEVLKIDEETGSRIWGSEGRRRGEVSENESEEHESLRDDDWNDDDDDADAIGSRVPKQGKETGFENHGK